MPNDIAQDSARKLGRRTFLQAATTTAGVLLLKPELVRGSAANSAVRVGLLGCGGRGTEDATNLVDTGNARVVALADLFRDQIEFESFADSSGNFVSQYFNLNKSLAHGAEVADGAVEGDQIDATVVALRNTDRQLLAGLVDESELLEFFVGKGEDAR